MLNWSERNVLETGGCSFIGSHLVGGLVERGARVRVVDNLSSGKQEHIQHWIDLGVVDFLYAARVGFYEGLDRTIEWYYNNHDVQKVSDELQQRLMRR